MKSATQMGTKSAKKKSTTIPFASSGDSFDVTPYELELHKFIEDKAYLLAEKDGFRGSPVDYWLTAEREIRQYY